MAEYVKALKLEIVCNQHCICAYKILRNVAHWRKQRLYAYPLNTGKTDDIHNCLWNTQNRHIFDRMSKRRQKYTYTDLRMCVCQNVDNYVKTFEMSINNTHFTRIEERLFCINTRNSHCYMILFVCK